MEDSVVEALTRDIARTSVGLHFDLFNEFRALVKQHVASLDRTLEKTMRQIGPEHGDQQQQEVYWTALEEQRKSLSGHEPLMYRALALLVWSEVENIFKWVLGWGGKLTSAQLQHLNFEKVDIYFRAIEQPLCGMPRYDDVAVLHKICNRLKHHGGAATRTLRKQGYADESGYWIGLTEEHVEKFSSACREFLGELLDVAPWTMPETSS